MARKTIFMETAFWVTFSECSRALFAESNDTDPVSIFERLSRWNDIYKFICRSNLYTDKPLSELAKIAEEKGDQMLKHILKRSGDGMIEMEYSEDPFPNLDTNEDFYPEDYSAVFLTRENHCIGASKLGLLNICIDNIWEQKAKFVDSGNPVRRDTEWTWRKMDILKETSNGVIIIDNYILAPYIDRQSGVENCTISFNLKELFKLLLPHSTPVKYPISIFYFDNSGDLSVKQQRKDSFFSDIQRFIKHERPNLDFILELFPTSTNEYSSRKDFHDRAILTNNIWVSSEAGFDLLKKDTTRATNAAAIKSTKTHGLYLGFGDEAASWLDCAYDQLIAEAKNCLKKYSYISENRLLE